MIFSDLSKAFLNISQESSRLKITQLLAEIYSNLTACESQVVTYLSMGTLRAQYLKNQFNFAQKNIEKLVTQILSQDLNSFKFYEKKIGDLGTAILQSNWPYHDSKLTIEQVYQQLCKLQEISGTNSQEEKFNILLNLLKQVDAISASFIVRIILGTMRLGFSDMTIIDSLSWLINKDKSLRTQIENAYNISADLGIIAYYIKTSGLAGLKCICPTVGIPIRPAAAERASSAAAIIDKIGPCIAQPKLDGFRLQIHIDKSNSENKPKIWFYSRNLQDMSNMFPDLVAALEAVPVDNIIMEGEAIVYDEQSQTFLPFQETVKRKRKHNIEEVAQTLPLRFFLFDVLYINNQPVLDKPYKDRRAILVKYFGDYKPNAIHVIEEKFCQTAQELNNYFNQNITQGLEGLVVKRPDAPYQPGKRNFNWIKLKRQEKSHLTDTIDAVILGYYTGRGKRAHFGIGAFLVGVYNQEKDRFETIAKVGTGLKDADWLDLKSRCDKIKSNSKPTNIDCKPELEPDIWVNPEIVVVILADEITQSPMHTAAKTNQDLGLALRFPRFMGYSVDKKPEQATEVKEIRRLYNLQFSRKSS